ncbi:uncharacterized protein LOC111242139 [Vigna radiata var. radiata]|uniref:Uncharacterized protein LOC111242139 n=1 Tax=Vigna radiata var. radiata TaxID=3916 RepID=A0A3Q0FCW1_VIGRR|nr:uncharacterized protein LOC111242139 [Vigna radiata var. radiata]
MGQFDLLRLHHLLYFKEFFGLVDPVQRVESSTGRTPTSIGVFGAHTHHPHQLLDVFVHRNRVLTIRRCSAFSSFTTNSICFHRPLTTFILPSIFLVLTRRVIRQFLHPTGRTNLLGIRKGNWAAEKSKTWADTVAATFGLLGHS